MMKKLSGEVLSKVLWTLQKCNVAERSRDEVRDMLLAALDVEDLYVEVPMQAKSAAEQATAPRFPTFDEDNLQRLNALLPWSSFSAIGADAVLGSAWSSRKRHTITRYPDAEIEALNKRLPLAGMSVLELGCFEGHHSICLATHCREVWGIDGRIENVIKSLVRVWMAGMERQIAVNMLDLERGRLKDQLASLGRVQPFDLTHHRGVLYHLSNPVSNLVQCAEVSRKHLYVHTQIAHDAQADTTIKHETGEYEVFRYKEPKTSYAPFSGITPHAHWMTQKSLDRLLRAIGFPQIDVVSLREERNGLRLELIASR